MTTEDLGFTDEELGLDVAVNGTEDLAGTVATGELNLDALLEADSIGESFTSNEQGPLESNRPDGISRIVERNLQAVAESFAMASSRDLANLLRTTVKIEYRGLRRTSYGEYEATMPNPTACAVVSLMPLASLSLLQLDLNLCFVFQQKLMGGPMETEGPARAFTEIEHGIATNLVERLTRNLRKGMADWTDLEPRIVKLENNPAYLRGLDEDEALVVVRFHVSAPPAAGAIDLVAPLTAFQPASDTR